MRRPSQTQARVDSTPGTLNSMNSGESTHGVAAERPVPATLAAAVGRNALEPSDPRSTAPNRSIPRSTNPENGQRRYFAKETLLFLGFNPRSYIV